MCLHLIKKMGSALTLSQVIYTTRPDNIGIFLQKSLISKWQKFENFMLKNLKLVYILAIGLPLLALVFDTLYSTSTDFKSLFITIMCKVVFV